MLEVEPLCGGMLHVSEQHRRKGLARVVCLDLLSKLHSRWTAIQQEQQADVARVVGDPVGHGVYVYVVEDNEPSRRLMQALDMRHTGMFTWLGFERTASTS
jgi:RimJ/RimL family protein N-acetyltransferase